MTAPAFHLLDTVALLGDVPAHGLARGQVGTLVEFSDDHGRASAMPDLREDQMLALRFAEADAA